MFIFVTKAYDVRCYVNLLTPAQHSEISLCTFIFYLFQCTILLAMFSLCLELTSPDPGGCGTASGDVVAVTGI